MKSIIMYPMILYLNLEINRWNTKCSLTPDLFYFWKNIIYIGIYIFIQISIKAFCVCDLINLGNYKYIREILENYEVWFTLLIVLVGCHSLEMDCKLRAVDFYGAIVCRYYLCNFVNITFFYPSHVNNCCPFFVHLASSCRDFLSTSLYNTMITMDLFGLFDAIHPKKSLIENCAFNINIFIAANEVLTRHLHRL